MSRYEAFCNTNTDLSMILPEIDSFDRKRLLQNFIQHSGSVYVSHDAGYVSQLYIDGLEGTSVASVSDINANNKYFYDSSADALYLIVDAVPGERVPPVVITSLTSSQLVLGKPLRSMTVPVELLSYTMLCITPF